MVEFTKLLSMSAAGMQAQAQRMQRVTENIANADTPGYHRKLVSFGEAVSTNQNHNVGRLQVSLDPSPARQIFDPAHPLANEDGYYEGSNVDLVIEIADAREAQRSYEANLRIFDQTRKMSKNLLELLRR